MKRIQLAVLAAICSTGSAIALAAEDDVDRALQALLRQADYWESNQRPDLASQALERYLISQPGSPEVVFRLAMQARAEGRSADAERWSQRLAELVPSDDPRILELNRADADSNISQLQLSRVRELAREGRYEDAVGGYQDMFSDGVPPRSLAPEYYQTLAGTPNGWTEARDQLRRLHELSPEDANLAAAYAEVLTYREQTRREGIDRLDALAAQNAQLGTPLRQALLWLDARQSDRARYQRYMERWPEHSEVMAHFESRAVIDRRQDGFAALDAGELETAEQAFREALRADANDADAMAGIGLVMLRRERFEEAVDWLERAMEGAPALRAELAAAYAAARYYAVVTDDDGANPLNLESELARLRALDTNTDDPGIRLIEADMLRRLGRFGEAETILRAILVSDAGNRQARDGLADTLRDRAATEPPFTAETTLRSALRLNPDHLWARIDLARLLQDQGQGMEAERTLEPMLDFDATPEQRHAAALFYAERQNWARVDSLIGGIDPAERSEEVTALLQRGMISQQFDRARTLIEQDRNAEASLLLESLYEQDGLSPAMAGVLALSLNEMGRRDLALSWVQRDLAREGDKLPSAYGNHALVLAQLDYQREADQLMEELRRNAGQGLAEREALMNVRHGLGVIRADKLREQGQLASAYDQLVQPLRESPDDETLLLAMARVYSTGERHAEAQEIYNYVLGRNRESVPALEGALQAALANGDVNLANQLVSTYNLENSTNPEHLMLAANVARQRGSESHALDLLNRARNMVIYGSPELVGETRSDGNPFRDANQAGARNAGTLSWLPGREPPPFYDTEASQDLVMSSQERRINEAISSIRGRQAMQVNAGVELNVRSGESGLSQLERLEVAPLSASGTPLGNGRLALNLTPAVLNSGDVEDEAQRRFGRNALPVAAGALGGREEELRVILDSVESSANNYFSAKDRAEAARNEPTLPESEKLRLEGEARTAEGLFRKALERNPVYEAGLRLEELSDTRKAALARYFGEDVLATQGLALSDASLEDFLASREVLEAAFVQANAAFAAQGALQAPDYQRESGLGVAVRYDNDSFGVDLGATPLGFEVNNFVGGVQWEPAITDNLRLRLNLQQRAVKESVLSYAGTVDPYSGEAWGGVVRRGGTMGFSYHNADATGFYADIGAYQYIGENVAANRMADFNFGAYVRPYNRDDRYLQTGVHVNAMGFSDDLSHFTFGHGGYFSPQEFLSLAFPVSFEADNGRLNYMTTFTPGYQSFSLDGNSLYPTDPEAQELANIFAAMQALPGSGHAGASRNGLGMSFDANVGYQVSDTLRVGGNAGFSSFGNFNDYSFKLYLQYTKGGKP